MKRIKNAHQWPLQLSRASIAFWLLLIVSVFGCQAESTPHDPLTLTATLVEQLHDPSPDVRRTAALSLGKIGHSAGTQALVKALADPDPIVRQFSAWSLGQIGEAVNTDAAIALVSALGDGDMAVKQAAAKALGNIGIRDPIIPLLIEGLKVGEVKSRRAVVEALMQLEGKSAYPVLVDALADPDPSVRQGAIAALGELGDRQALPKFRTLLLKDQNVGVRAEAAYRLGKLGDLEDIPSLQKAAHQDTTAIVHLWTTWAIDNIAPLPMNEGSESERDFKEKEIK